MRAIRNDNPNLDFTTEHYREMMQAIRDSHRTLCFRDVHVMGREIFDIPKFVIMRHDVEFSIPAALRLAEIEAEFGIQSTFFLLQTSDYNPFEEEEAVQIRRILELGHDIGLHYDAALFERLEMDAAATAEAQIRLFETFFSTKIHAMSSHMPMRSGRTFSLPGVIDTYDPMYLTEMKYISDSTQAWREGVITENLERHNHIHLLTHEYIWHPGGWDWSALLFVEVQDKFARGWKRAENFINMYREGLKMRSEKDRKFKERYMKPEE
ncbi:MAG: hypothetical protein ACPGXX_07400 [Planctomycetaceae bacterium]